jgi:hypothetical protein
MYCLDDTRKILQLPGRYRYHKWSVGVRETKYGTNGGEGTYTLFMQYWFCSLVITRYGDMTIFVGMSDKLKADKFYII